MMEDALSLSLPEGPQDFNQEATPRMLDKLARAPERAGFKVDGDGLWGFDGLATFAAFKLLEGDEDRVPRIDARADSQPQSHLPDQALVSWMLRAEGVSLFSDYFESEQVRRRAVLQLIDAHQTYHGPVAEAWAEIWRVQRTSSNLRQFALRLTRAVRYSDASGEQRFEGLYPTPKSAGFSLRILAEFYESCTCEAEPGDVAESLAGEIARLRFSRTLTAIETLWDVVLSFGAPPLQVRFGRPREPWSPSFSTDAKWTTTPDGFRLGEHSLTAPLLSSRLSLSPLVHYERAWRGELPG